MASHGTRGRVADQVAGHVRAARRRVADADGLGSSGLLDAERVAAAVAAEGVTFRDCLYTPLVTIWTFLAQVLGADKSCSDAVSRLLAFVSARPAAGAAGAGDDPGGEPDTSPYCKARKRLPERLVSRLAAEAGAELHTKYPAGRLLGGRPVKVADGTTVSMPDTPENQAAWPQPDSQKAGLGFPIARLVVVFSLHCAAALGVAVGPYAGKETGETALLRSLYGDLCPGDVLLADRCYASFWALAVLLGRGVDSLMRQHQKRKPDFRTGTRLGHDDHLITLAKPDKPPDWMDRATYDALPAEITVREVRVRVAVKGFRVKWLVLVTTLLDAAVYTKAEIAKAFRCRWHAELDIRAIKDVMGMGVLRCHTPDLVRKEVWMHLLAYNRVRAVMAEAADGAGIEPRAVSFKGAVQALDAFAPVLALADPSDVPRLWDILLRAIARRRVGRRPDRYEPRAVKRRPKAMPLLTVPRDTARKRLARGIAEATTSEAKG